MSEGNLPKGYTFHDLEPRWYATWSQEGLFRADVNSGNPPFTIVIPPPNVTGTLHMGHALNNTLQDILCRYMKLKGMEVLWVPGTDHAGIATQNVVERDLAKEDLSRHELGREAFLDRVWVWKEKYGGIITNQLRRLGAMCDWSRERFTMDEGLSKAVRQVFVTLYDQGLIYRGKRMINWCPRCMTALANIEVEGEELDSHLYYLRYPLIDGSGSVVVATTRPETMLGDTAVAVHPEDPRYSGFVGKDVLLPLAERRIPVIGDSYVDREFGTGALKITPAHDFNDFEIGRKHKLDLVQVLADDGTMSADAGRYAGLDRFACRKQVLEDLERGGFLEKIEPYKHRVGHCYRCKSVVEPSLSLQWFVDTKPLAEKAMEAVRDGRTRIIPLKWEKDYFNWLENVEDWCISRQIWWGHRIPAWYCGACGKVIVSMTDPTSCPDCGSSDLARDEDVLDTWFSSALWPFSTLGWPEDTPDLRKFYPTSVLVTGFDILFFWVARMMMMGLHFKQEVPFRDVYVHALVRDAHGHKMSKSKGNVIDPLIMMDQFGTDALRFTLTALAVQGRDVKLSEERIEGYRHFVNKIWNAARLVLMNCEDTGRLPEIPKKPERLWHRWILSRLQRVIGEVDASITEYHFNQYAHSVYHFVWREFCDWYLEMIKQDFYGEDPNAKALAQAVSLDVLRQILLLLHPVMPFVTEEIWQKLPGSDGSIMTASLPTADPERLDATAEEMTDTIMAVVSGIRNIRGEMNISPALRVDVVCLCGEEAQAALLREYGDTINDLARLSSLKTALVGEGEKPKMAASTIAKGIEVYVLLEGILDFDSESKRLEKELAKVEKEYGLTQRKLANEDFLARAPQDVIEKEKEKGSRLGEKIDKVRAQLERIKTIRSSAQG